MLRAAPGDDGTRTALTEDDRWLAIAYPSPPEHPSAVLSLPEGHLACENWRIEVTRGMTAEATGLTTRGSPGHVRRPADYTIRLRPRRACALRAVLQHRAQLTEWTGRLAYRLVIAGSVARLHRDPAGPQRTAAPATGAPPSRRALTLMALTAAACEDADMTTTVQALSDEVRAISAAPGARVMPYNPDRRTERQAFLRRVNQLAGLGILLRRTTDEALLRQWETATRSQRILRTLVEDTVLPYADLYPEDAEYARGQRSWLAGHASDMTGGTIEIREEGMLLRLPPDRPASAAATVPFPAATATRGSR